MNIESIQLQTIRLRLREPFRISSGETYERRILLVKVLADGRCGYGECVAGETPHYSYETVETARLMLTDHLIPAVLGRDFETAAETAAAAAPLLDRAVRGHPMARAALEMALWDLEAKRRGVPLARLLGGKKDAVAAGVSIGLQPDEESLLQRVGDFLDLGYLRIKIKIAPGRDVRLLSAIRDRFPDIALTVDANAAYTAGDIQHLADFDRFGLDMLEQPFAPDELQLHAELQARASTSICLDETITSPAMCALALRLEAGRIVNIKPGRIGGHLDSIRIHDLCERADVPVWCGGMLEAGIGRAHNVALASLPNFRLPSDTSESRRYWLRDIVAPEFRLRPDGKVPVPTGIGIGVEVDEEFLSSIQEDLAVFGTGAPVG